MFELSRLKRLRMMNFEFCPSRIYNRTAGGRSVCDHRWINAMLCECTTSKCLLHIAKRERLQAPTVFKVLVSNFGECIAEEEGAKRA